MPTRTIETDYLVVGCGAAGMAFTDALVSDSDADVVMVDRRHAPGLQRNARLDNGGLSLVERRGDQQMAG